METMTEGETETRQGAREDVRIDLQEAFGHAKPWIARTRAVVVDSHVFYKINYALAADNKGRKP